MRYDRLGSSQCCSLTPINAHWTLWPWSHCSTLISSENILTSPFNLYSMFKYTHHLRVSLKLVLHLRWQWEYYKCVSACCSLTGCWLAKKSPLVLCDVNIWPQRKVCVFKGVVSSSFRHGWSYGPRTLLDFAHRTFEQPYIRPPKRPNIWITALCFIK